jgi:hypothetical protein
MERLTFELAALGKSVAEVNRESSTDIGPEATKISNN